MQVDAFLHPFISQFSGDAKRLVLDRSHTCNAGPNTVIFDEGDAFDGMYLVLKGRVAFYKSLPNRKLQLVSTTGEGEHFGELGIFTENPRSLRATTLTETLWMHLPAVLINDLIERNEFPLVPCISGLVSHLQETTEQYVTSVVQQQQLAIIGQMVSSLIHDFRGPLGAISLGAQFLRGKHTQDLKTQQTCRTIENQVNRINRMATDILEYVRGEQHLEVTTIAFPRFFEDFRELFPMFFDGTVAIDISCPEPFALQGDFDRLVRVFQNLISNAIDALQGRADGNIHISAGIRDNEALFTVEDNGPGIPERIREHLFEPFVTEGKKNGTGLGMAIVKTSIEAHRGRIRFESEPQKGTTFTFNLPLDS